jgi:hypothetical protein
VPATALVPPAATGTRRSAALRQPATIGGLTARRSGPYVLASLRPGRSGRLRVTVLRGRRKLRSCDVRVRAGRAISCRLKAPGEQSGLRLTATLRAPGRKPLSRTIRVARPGAAHDHGSHEHPPGR